MNERFCFSNDMPTIPEIMLINEIAVNKSSCVKVRAKECILGRSPPEAHSISIDQNPLCGPS